MSHSLNDRVLAIAGVFQAAELVNRTAYKGRTIDANVETCITSLFKIDTNSVEDIYGSRSNLQMGLNTMLVQMGSKTGSRDVNIPRYVVSLLHLQKKLSRNNALLKTLTDGLARAQEQVNYFTLTHENVIAGLADLYQQTISTLTPKIMVSGQPERLQESDNAHLIRALLLTGIRSSMAWHQCGGSRWQILTQRKTILREARSILDNLHSIDTRV